VKKVNNYLKWLQNEWGGINVVKEKAGPPRSKEWMERRKKHCLRMLGVNDHLTPEHRKRLYKKCMNANPRDTVQMREAGFEDKPKGWTDKSIKKYSKTFSGKMKGNVKSKDFFDKCVKKMQGKVDSPEGFCAALKDEAHGSTFWRGKGKKPAEVKRDVTRHKNV